MQDLSNLRPLFLPYLGSVDVGSILHPGGCVLELVSLKALSNVGTGSCVMRSWGAGGTKGRWVGHPLDLCMEVSFFFILRHNCEWGGHLTKVFHFIGVDRWHL